MKELLKNVVDLGSLVGALSSKRRGGPDLPIELTVNRLGGDTDPSLQFTSAGCHSGSTTAGPKRS